MYLTARIFGISVYLLTLVFMVLISNKVIKKQNRKIILVLYSILLSIMSFFFVPPIGEDLYRLFDTLHYYANLSSNEFFHALSEHSFPLAVIYFRLIGLTHVDGLLPSITALIIFSLCFYILYNASVKYTASPYVFSVALYLLMSRGFFVWAISNIRTWLVIALICFCLYRELFLNKSFLSNIPVYIMVALLHASGIALLLLRLIFLTIEKAPSAGKKIRNFIIVSISATVIYILGNKYIVAFLNKGESYFSFRQEGKGFFYIWEFILTILHLLLSLYLLYLFKKYSKQNINDVTQRITEFYVFYLSVMILFGIFEYNLFFRLSFVLVVLNIPLFLSICNYLDIQDNRRNKKIICSNLLIYCSLILFIACARGNLCSLKFFM